MVLEHQGLLPNLQSGQGLQPALQLYAAAAAHLGPRSRVPPWAPFLQFGVPGVFGGPFFNRPRFGFGPPTGPGLGGLNNSNNVSHAGISPPRGMPGPPSEDSNDDRGEFHLSLCYSFLFELLHEFMCGNSHLHCAHNCISKGTNYEEN